MTLIPVARALGMGERLAYTLGGLGLVVWWLLPFDVPEAIAGETPKMDFSIFIVSGLMVVLGAVWAIVYNADVLRGCERHVRPDSGAAPVLRMAVAYPLRSRFRTGVTLAMFTLVVFTLVMGAATSGSFISAYDNEREFAGEPRSGRTRWQRARSPTCPGRLGGCLRSRAASTRSRAESVLFGKARQLGTSAKEGPIRSTASTTPT